MAPERKSPGLRAWVVARSWIVGTGLAVGLVVGAAGMGGWTLYTGDHRGSAATVFALGALAFGFGLLGWSGSVLAGPGIENMQQYMGTNSDWNERDSRRAMARICGFGSGVMVGSSLVEALL